MDRVKGILLNSLPFKMDKFVGDILYHEFPVMSVYDFEESPLIIEWLDSEDDLDRYFAYQPKIHSLKRFLDGKISHWELMNSLFGNTGFVFEENSEGEKLNVTICPASNLSREYIPSQNSFFITEHGVDHAKVKQYFNLDSLEPIIVDSQAATKSISQSINSELINLHLKSGNGIGYGKVDTRLLGNALIKFDKLYREVALDQLLGAARGDIKMTSTNQEQNLISSTEVVINKAASYSVFIRPIYSQLSLFGGTVTSEIALKIKKVFKQTADVEEIKRVYNDMSDYVFKAYKGFLTEIVKQEIALNINWFNPENQEHFDQSFNLVFANKVIENIKNINTQKQEEIRLKGKFNRLHCDTGHFSLISNQDEVFTGYFDVLLRDGMAQRNFVSMYDIVINQSVSKEAGKAEPTIANTILSCIEMTDSD